VVTQKQDFKNKYLEQVELNSQLESEVEHLRKQINDLSDLSFARGAGFNSARGGGIGIGGGKDNFGDMLNASSIMDEEEVKNLEELTVNKNQQLQSRVATLEDEVQQYKQRIENLKSENQELKLTNTSQEATRKEDDEEIENFRHVKNLFIQFLEATPVQASKKEDLIPVIFSMLNMSKGELTRIKTVREQLSAASVKEAGKKGVFGMFGGGAKK